MKILLHLPIEVDDDGAHCGGCRRLSETNYCRLFWKYPEASELVGPMGENTTLKRLPECLAAEREAREKKIDAVFAHRRKAKLLLGIPPRIPKERS